MIPVVNPESWMFPVCPPPKTRLALLRVWILPLAERRSPFVPLVPPESEATGVRPAAMLRTENLAELVATPPSNKSSVVLFWIMIPPVMDWKGEVVLPTGQVAEPVTIPPTVVTQAALAIETPSVPLIL